MTRGDHSSTDEVFRHLDHKQQMMIQTVETFDEEMFGRDTDEQILARVESMYPHKDPPRFLLDPETRERRITKEVVLTGAVYSLSCVVSIEVHPSMLGLSPARLMGSGRPGSPLDDKTIFLEYLIPHDGSDAAVMAERADKSLESDLTAIGEAMDRVAEAIKSNEPARRDGVRRQIYRRREYFRKFAESRREAGRCNEGPE